MRFLSRFIFIFLVVLTGQFSWAQVCKDFNYQVSMDSEREDLLQMIKESLVVKSFESGRQLDEVINSINNCNTEICQKWVNEISNIIKDQYKAAKISKAIAHSVRGSIFRKARSPRTIAQMVSRMQSGTLTPEHIAHFNISGFNYTASEKQDALKAWYHIFLKFANDVEHTKNLDDAINKTRNYFKNMDLILTQNNILLAFLNDSYKINGSTIVSILKLVKEINNNFNHTIQGFKTKHSTSFWSNVAILMTDHEMGLVNFDNVATNVILSMNNEKDYSIACSAWKDLKRQQSVKVNTSIGVGFATSIACGVGVVYLAPLAATLAPVAATAQAAAATAIGACIPSIVDGAVGGTRGVLNARLAEQSFYAGRDYENISDSHGIIDLTTSKQLINQNGVVATINFLGILPVAASISTLLRTGAKQGKAIELLKLPTVDSSVSYTESQSSAIAYLMILMKGLEFFDSDLDKLVEFASTRD